MPAILFHQSKQQELETILWTIKNHKTLEKFCSNTIYPKLSKNLWQTIIEDDNKFKNSRKSVKEYLEKTNQLILNPKTKQIVIPLWRKIEKDFFNKVEKILNIKPLEKYICYLIKYGSGGSFNPPNTIWVRMNLKNKNDIKYFTYTVAHETTHLLFDKKYKNRSQEEKEINQILKIDQILEEKIDQILLNTGLFK